MNSPHLQLIERFSHLSHHYVHLTYLGLVFFESHGLYGVAAGVLGVVVVIEGAVEHKLAKRK